MNTEMVVRDIPLSDVLDNPYQPRKRYGKTEMRRLARNIKQRGLLHPIAVVRVKDKYVVVSGHRRTRAFRTLRRKTIPAIIRKQSTQDDLALDLAIENALRKDFTPIEKAHAIFQVLNTISGVQNDLLRAYSLVGQVKLMNSRGISQIHNLKGNCIGFSDDDVYKCEKLLNLLDCSENTAIKYLLLLTLPRSIQAKILCSNENDWSSQRNLEQGIISVSLGYELSRVKDDKLKVALYRRIVEEKLRYIEVKHVVDEILENEAGQQINSLGTSRRRGARDYGLEGLTKRCFRLSSSLWNFRRYLPVIPLSMDKIIFRASMKKLRKACLQLVQEINDTLEETVSEKEEIRLANSTELEVRVSLAQSKHTYRFTLPYRVVRKLHVEHGDKIRLDIKGIVKASNAASRKDGAAGPRR